MFIKLSLLLVFTLASITSSNKLPTIDVYFETLCPGCQEFITGSFKDFLANPSYKQLATVNFYPYGNAHEKSVGNQWQFTCQHGATECYGNVVEVCAMNKLSYEEGLKYIVCMETKINEYDADINKALASCIQEETLHRNILTCAKGNEGNSLQHAVAVKTPSDHKYVPWVNFNGQHDDKVGDKLLMDMTSYLCGLGDNSKLVGCKDLTEKINESSIENKCMNSFLDRENLFKFLA